jgi:hypothetical protein
VIVCTRCGHGNDVDEEFCAACGAFLEWSGEVVEEPDDDGASSAADAARGEDQDPANSLTAELPVVAHHRSWISRAVSHIVHEAPPLPERKPVAPDQGASGGRSLAVRIVGGPRLLDRSPDRSPERSAKALAETSSPLADPDADVPEGTGGAQATGGDEGLIPSGLDLERARRRQAARVRPSRRVAERSPGKPVGHRRPVHPRDLKASQPHLGVGHVHCFSCQARNESTRVLCISCGALLDPSEKVSAFQPAGDQVPSEAVAGEGAGEGGEAEEGGDGAEPVEGKKRGALGKKPKKPKKPKLLAKLKPKKASSGGQSPSGVRPRKFARMSASGGAPGGGKLMKAGFVFGAVVIVLALVGPFSSTVRNHVTAYVSDVRKFLRPNYTPVVPVSAMATSSAPGHPPSMAIDNVVNTSWETGPAKDGIGQSITIGFAGTQRIDKVGFISGDQSTPKSFRTEPRPHQVTLTWSNGHSKKVSLQDVSSFQVFSAHELHVRWVKVTIDSVYPSASGTDCAIAEIEFFKLI